MTMAEPLTDVQRAFAALKAKQGSYNLLWRFYNGDQPLQYANRRMEQIFSRLDAKWCENWCAVVVDSVVDRINLSGFSIKDKVAKTLLDKVWSQTDAGLDAERVHKAVSVCGEGYIIMNQDETGEVQLFANRPHLVHSFYSEDNPKEMEFSAKWWEV